MLSLKDQYGLNGRIINDKYLIEALIGIGGMSAVYCAQQFGVVRRVAFKILLPHLAANNDKMVRFFEREARTAGRLLHENIATVFDAGHTEDDLAYIVMEWLDGVTLEEELRKNGVFSLERVAALVRQIASALDTAHVHKVIHRDLKPSNIMLIRRADGEEQAKVLDFGLAKLATEANDFVSHAVGTPHYASPEQFQLGSEIDARTDIYSFGVMLYQLLSGRLPFNSPSIHEVIRMHMLEMPRPIRELRPDIPPGIEELLQRMMAKMPHYRPQTAREVAELFEHVWQGCQQNLPASAAAPAHIDANFLNDISLVDGLLRSNVNANTRQPARRTGDLPPGSPEPFSKRPTIQVGVRASAAAAPALQPPSPIPTFTSPPVETPTQFNVQTGTSPVPVFTVSYSTNNTVSPRPAISLNNTAGTSSLPIESIRAGASGSQSSPSGLTNLRSTITGLVVQRDKRVFGLIGLALAVLALGTGYRFYHPAITMTETDTILVADFSNTTQDEVFDGALRQALMVQLAQTPYLNQLADEKVRETLRYMGRQPHDKLTREVAREICQRQGVKALIVGRIERFELHYALTLEAINAQTGEVLASSLEEAPNKDRVLKALDNATIDLREALGESLSSIKKFNKPSEYATTFSLEALKAYTLGRETNTFKGNPVEALALYKRATELDPSFALAYIGQASIYANQGQPELSAQAAERAFALRERVSEQEKITINTLYYLAVSGEVEKAIETFNLARRTYPRTISPPINLSVCYGRIGQYDEALRLATEANQLDPRNSITYSNRAELLVRLGRYGEARGILDQAFGQKLDRASYHALLYQLAFLKGDTVLMQQQTEWATGKPEEFRSYEWQAQAAATQGKIQAASEFVRRSSELGMQRNLKEAVAAVRVTAATHALLSGVTEPATQDLRELFEAYPNLFTRFTIGTVAPYATVALALSGQTEAAQKIIDETTQRQPRNTLAQFLWLPTVRAAIALKKNDPTTALEALQATRAHESAGMFFPTWLRGQAYLRLKQGREAATEFERIRAHRGWDVLSPLYPLAQLELARAYRLRGDNTLAQQAYEDFLAQWKEADAKLPVLLNARKEAATLK